MSTDEPTSRRGSRRFTRRQVLALGAGGAGLAAFTHRAFGQNAKRSTDKPPPRGQVVASLKYRGSAIRVERANGRKELYIDDEYIRTVNNTGEYRAAGFMFSPKPTPEALGKGMIDARRALSARGIKAEGKKMIP